MYGFSLAEYRYSLGLHLTKPKIESTICIKLKDEKLQKSGGYVILQKGNSDAASFIKCKNP
jgi:hypothetical protein